MARERASERVKERERGGVEEDSRGEILVRAERGRESRARVEDKVVEKEETRRTGEASSARCRRTDPTCVRIPAGRTDRPASLSLFFYRAVSGISEGGSGGEENATGRTPYRKSLAARPVFPDTGYVSGAVSGTCPTVVIIWRTRFRTATSLDGSGNYRRADPRLAILSD